MCKMVVRLHNWYDAVAVRCRWVLLHVHVLWWSIPLIQIKSSIFWKLACVPRRLAVL